MRRGLSLWLILAFAGLGPTASLRPCPVHAGGHHEAGHGAMSAMGTPAPTDHAGDSHDHASSRGARTEPGGAAHSGGSDPGKTGPIPCDCLGLCLTCAVALPNAGAAPRFEALTTVSRTVPLVPSLVRGDPATYLIPLAKPPPA